MKTIVQCDKMKRKNKKLPEKNVGLANKPLILKCVTYHMQAIN